ncbi:MAG: HNH endonuclease [Longicatena sp.]|uniref:HNH endonuclease signature motif containing protein n=1 Tax=Anaerorhabdus sp. TaxID=1872524 RepID=UPI002FCC64CE
MKVDVISINYNELLNACIDRIQDIDRRKRFIKVKSLLEKDKKLYLSKANLSDYHLIQRKKLHSSELSVDNHKWLYDERLVKSKAGRVYYQKIMSSQEICLYCGVRDVETLDHFLSKGQYPNYSVLPENLVPCCSKCNTLKGDYDISAIKKEDYFLHPYHDDLNKIKWLNGDIKFIKNELLFDFYIDSTHITNEQEQRLQKMFDIIEIRELYANKASRKLKREIKFLRNLYLNKGEKELKEMFSNKYENLNVEDDNDFEKVYYRILSQGIKLIIKYLDGLT